MILVRLLVLIFFSTGAASSYAQGTAITKQQAREWSLEGHASLLTSSLQCGNIYAIDESFIKKKYSGNVVPQYLSVRGTTSFKSRRSFPSYKRKVTTELSFHSPDAQLFLTDPMFKHWKPKQIYKHLNFLLLAAVQSRVQARLEEEMQYFAPVDSQRVAAYLEKAQTALFLDHESGKIESHPQRRLRLMFTLYPELIEEILSQEDDALKPLLCPFQQHEHEVKMLRRWSQVLAIPALGLGISAITVGSMGLVIPPLAIAAGVSACVVGVKDISFGVRDIWHKEKAGYVANKIRLLGRELKRTVARLEKKEGSQGLNADEAQLLASLQELHKARPQERKRTLRRVCMGPHGNRLLIAFGVLNIGFNSLNLTGDPTLLADLPGQIFKLLGIV